MLAYLDVSCLNRPFDDQRQARIRLESEAVALILDRTEAGRWRQVSSQIAEIEISAMPDAERRRRVMALLPEKRDRIRLSGPMFSRAAELQKEGFKAADALHLAAAEALGVDVFLTCDDRLCRLAVRKRSRLIVRVANPIPWVRENLSASDA